MPRRVQGKVIRFGSRGFGFIQSKELSVAAWFHHRTLRFPEDVPAVGDAVEFDVFELPDGRIQARDVTPPGAGPLVPSVPPPAPHGVLRAPIRIPQALLDRLSQERAAAVIARADRVAETPVEYIPAPVAEIHEPVEEEPPTPGSIAERVLRILDERDGSPKRLLAEADGIETRCRDVETRIEEVRCEAERRIREIREESERERKRAEALRTRASAAVLRPEDRNAAWSQVLGERRANVTTALAERAGLFGTREAARRSAVAARGEGTVERYDEVRRRLRTEKDPLSVEAFTQMEATRRREIERYAEAVDRTEKAAPLAVPVLLSTRGGALTAVVPLDAEIDGEGLGWRVVATICHAMENAARDLLGANAVPPVYGEVGDCMAARLAGPVDRELFELLLGDAWLERPTLGSHQVILVTETAPALDFTPFGESDMEPQLGAPASGGPLPNVGRRLGLALYEIVAALVAHGMPFRDDNVEAGVESSLRDLLGLGAVRPSAEPQLAAGPSGAAPGRSAAAVIASRVLAKLLRDGRVGGRHTRVEHAFAHGFTDQEKPIARHVVDRLLVMGLLRKKLNEGSFHVYIDPRRLREVWAIINLEWQDERVFG